MGGTLDVVVQRRRCRRQRGRTGRGPERLHIFHFRLATDDPLPRLAAVLVRGRMDQVAAIGPAYERARRLGRAPFCTGVLTVPPPRPTPALDAICAKHTAFPSFTALLVAPGGYRPSIRLDLLGRDGVVLARAYDRWQGRWGDPRRAYVTGAVPRRAGSALP